MAQADVSLVVGAGATGLVAALELAHRRQPVRVIERRTAPSALSRAVGILPMSMPLLERLGVAGRIRDEAVAIASMRLFDHDRPIVEMPLDRLDAHLRLFSLPQDRTEAILVDRLAQLGVSVEYGRSFDGLAQDEAGVDVAIGSDTVRCNELLGADGSRSSVRHALGVPFEGYDLEGRWSIADVDVREPARAGLRVHLLADGNAVFLIPIGERRLRVVATVADALAALPIDIGAENVRRTGDFTIGVRQVPRYREGRVSLAGDAAHTHSPVGGRGMNLGMADGADWSVRLTEGRLAGYSASRHTAGQEIIHFTETMRRRIMTPDGFARRNILRFAGIAMRLPLVVERLNRQVLLPGYAEASSAN